MFKIFNLSNVLLLIMGILVVVIVFLVIEERRFARQIRELEAQRQLLLISYPASDSLRSLDYKLMEVDRTDIWYIEFRTLLKNRERVK